MNKIFLLLLVAATASLSAYAQKAKKTAPATPRTLIAYFSATGTTARAAARLAQMTGGELHEIAPKKSYTTADLDWRDQQSRCYMEMHDLSFRPALKNKKSNIAEYDVIYLGYPIWWNIAPTLINTFIEAHALNGKTVIPFATSGGSTIDNSVTELKKSYPKIKWKSGKLLNSFDEKAVKAWINK